MPNEKYHGCGCPRGSPRSEIACSTAELLDAVVRRRRQLHRACTQISNLKPGASTVSASCASASSGPAGCSPSDSVPGALGLVLK